MEKDAVAIIGLGCRFPGGINDAESLWKLLVEGREAVSEVPADRWNAGRFYDPEPGIVGKSITNRGGFIDGLEQFDPQFFGISPREAPYVDPQHRLLLETAWEAIEDAGLVLDFEKGTDLAVFVGISHTDFQVIQGTPWDSSGITSHSSTGSAHSIAANRISYCLNLRGPSIAMDTACSSALTAVHTACEHIRAGRCTTALAGGVTVMITPGGFIGFSQASMLSPEGRCKAFAASADGFVRGEGAGMVLLKRLSDAIKDGDPIRGVILGTAVNQDGHTNGISLPSPEAQARLVREACEDAGISPSSVGFVEAHGTGTAVGDPIEAHALAEALCVDRPADAPLPIGSVKTNLGHMETAAGVAGLVKALLVLERGQIPASLHFDEPSPHIDFEGLKLRVPTKLEPFPEIDGKRIVGVNSFGFGGANAHVVLTTAPAHARTERPATDAKRGWPLVLSARSENALRALAGKLASWIDEHMKSNGTSPLLPDLAYTLGARRNHHSHRITLVASSTDEAIAELSAFAAGEDTAQKLRVSFSPQREHPARIGFVMSGQGPQWWGMGRELMKHEPLFRTTMERCAAALAPWTRFSLLEELAKDEASSQMSRTEIAQPAIFAMQVSLAELWKSWGIVPAAIVGHSVGEIAASCVAGILSLEEAARVIALRSKFMEDCARGEGAMLAVGLGEDEIRAIILRRDRTVTIAAYNGPRSLTLSGPRSSLEGIAAELEAEGVFARFVKVDHPFHHPMMKPAADSLTEALADLEPQPEQVPFFSTVTGARCKGESCDAVYWGKGIKQPVLFAPAIGALAEFGVDEWLEISAHPALAISIQECLAQRETKAPVRSSLRREREHETLLETAMDFHRASVSLDFAAVIPSRNLLTLPAYAWDKSRWWNEAPDWRDGRLAPGGRGLLDVRLARATPTWISRLDNRHMSYLKDHKVESHVIFPAAGFVELVLEVGQQIFEGRPFVIEDFEIRRPLILPENPTGLLLEISYDTDTRTFAVQSRQGTAWSAHVVGSMRGERVESEFSHSVRPAAMDLTPVEVEGFYTHMSDLGLRYGPEFRSVKELGAAQGQSAGKVALTEATAKRADEYPLHPVLLDGALHVFSAGQATVERKGRMKLPVRFARIQFVRSPGAVALVNANVRVCNDELVEGDVAIYDEAGQPCVLVEGFRAISLAAARRSGAPGGIRDLIYNVEWERTPAEGDRPALAPVPLAELHAVAEAALEEVVSVRGRDKLESTLAAEDELAAALIVGALQKMGVKKPFTAESLGVIEAKRPVFERFARNLEARGLLVRDGEKWKTSPTFKKAVSASKDALHTFLSAHPGHLPEGLLCANNCAELGPILRGEKDAVQVLFGGSNADLLDQFYGDGLFASQWMTSIASALRLAASKLPEGRGLRILEIGAGTGGLAAHVLPLLERGLHSYTFSDVSAGFFTPAAQKLAAFPEVEYKVFDLEKSGVEQEFEAGRFDFVIGTNCVHAVADVRSALRNVHDLLAPGGTFFFMDTASPQLWTDAVFGLTSGWWRFTDRDLRTEHPLLSRAQWEKTLREVGFADTASLAGLRCPHGDEGQIAVMARKEWAEQVEGSASGEVAEKSWLIFADEGGLGEKVAKRLSAAGADCRIVRRGGKFAKKGEKAFEVSSETPEDWTALLTAVAEAAPERMVWFWSLDEATDNLPLLGTDSLLHFTQALEKTMATAKLRIDLVTRGAQPIGSETVNVAQAPSIGLFRVMLSEHPQFSCRAFDLPPEAAAADLELVWNELRRSDVEREVAFRGEARYVQRITRGTASGEQWLDPVTPLRLESRERGILDALKFTPFAMPQCGKGEVLIEVKAAGMNFRDVLKALGLYPAETIDARIYGDEVGGVVVSVGEGVTHVAPGDHVFGIAVFGLATHTLARGGDVRKIPDGLSFEEAATLPVVFMTAWHALKNVARMRRGEKILIQAGAGGVGMAAIQIAQHLGVEVFATAGNPTKRALLKTMGVKHIIDSRQADFQSAVMHLTNNRGVDVVLNSLAAEAIPMGLACLAEFGRFIEIGKRDIYQNSKIPLWPLRANASFHVVAMDAVFNGNESLTRDLLAEVTTRVEKGAFRPLPFRSFPACRIDAAFRLMAQGKHIGKIVVAFPKPFVTHRGRPLPRDFAIRSDAAYLITGGLGGFGRVLATWLADNGARHLVLTSRSGASTPEAEAFVTELRERAEVEVVKADIGSAADVERLIGSVQASGHPLAGIFHLAMVIDDAPMAALTSERMRAVLEPKARGAWLLHEATRDLSLDAFVLFSSVSSVFGNPAQGNYSAANTFLDSLAHYRHSLGLAALTVNWGVLGGEGYVARNERVAEFLARQGTAAISPGEVLSVLESFLATGVTQAAAIRVDWSKWRQSFRGLQENPLLERIFASSVDEQSSGGASEDWKGRIAAAAPEEREEIIGQAVRTIIAGVLRVKPESLRDDQPLTDLGLDSLMGAEIETSIDSALGVGLPPTSLLRARTIGQIRTLIAEHMGASATPTAKPAAVVEKPASAEEVDLGALSDEDLDSLLADDPAEETPEKA